MSAPDFSKRTIEILSSRAAHRCSNPDCDKLTTGPHTVEDKKLLIGEAAHVYGARAGEQRYRAQMGDAERAAITNGIWLCRNCHGLIDKDPSRYPADLLLLWKKNHEVQILAELGTAGERLREVALDRSMTRFDSLPPFIRGIVRDKPNGWEYMFSAELLDHFCGRSFRRSRDLERGVILKPRKLLPPEQFARWVANKPAELVAIGRAVSALLEDLQNSWGELGEAGDENEIYHVCGLFGEISDYVTQIAEEMRFTSVPAGFEEVSNVLAEGALHSLKNFPALISFLRQIMSTDTAGISRRFELVIEMPGGWAERFDEALKIGKSALSERNGEW